MHSDSSALVLTHAFVHVVVGISWRRFDLAVHHTTTCEPSLSCNAGEGGAGRAIPPLSSVVAGISGRRSKEAPTVRRPTSPPSGGEAPHASQTLAKVLV